LIVECLRGALTEALHAGLSTTEVRRIVNQELSQLDGQVATVAATAVTSPDTSIGTESMGGQPPQS